MGLINEIYSLLRQMSKKKPLVALLARLPCYFIRHTCYKRTIPPSHFPVTKTKKVHIEGGVRAKKVQVYLSKEALKLVSLSTLNIQVFV